MLSVHFIYTSHCPKVGNRNAPYPPQCLHVLLLRGTKSDLYDKRDIGQWKKLSGFIFPRLKDNKENPASLLADKSLTPTPLHSH